MKTHLSILIIATLGSLAPWDVSARATPLFTSHFLAFEAGAQPTSVSIEDANGDGALDLAVANYWGSSISVLLGNGDGTFRAKTDYPTWGNARSVVMRDVNRDNRPDLVASFAEYNLVGLRLGTGNGTFGDLRLLATGHKPFSVVVADLNMDGRQDIATANIGSYYDPSSISILLGNGNGTFAPHVDLPAVSCYDLSVADVDSDGRPDLVAIAGGSISVFFGSGGGTFEHAIQISAGPSPSSFAIGDIDGDDRQDLVTTDESTHSVSILLGSGHRTFQTRMDFDAGARPTAVAIGDLDLDGRPDLAVAHTYNLSVVSVLLGRGDGTFGTRRDFPAGDRSFDVAIADFDSDGAADLAIPDYGVYVSDNILVLLGHGDGTFGTDDVLTGRNPTSLAFGDYNADCRIDLAVANAGSHSVTLIFGDGKGSFVSKVDLGLSLNVFAIAAADVNVDGRQDLIVTAATGGVMVLLGDEDGAFRSRTRYPTGSGTYGIAVADLDADGWPDLIAPDNLYTNTVSVLLGNGDGTFRDALHFGAGKNPFSVAIGDLNRDGKLDMAVANYGSDNVSVLAGNGDGTFGPSAEYPTGRNPRSVAITELNRDGVPDLALSNYDHSVSVLMGRTDGTFGPATSYGTDGPAFSMVCGDLNADGREDLAVANYIPSTVSVFLGRGDGTLEPRMDFGTSAGPYGIGLGDLDGDAQRDLAVTNYFSNSVTVLRNQGPLPQVLPIAFALVPATLNRTESGRWVTGILEPPAPYDAGDIEIGSIRLNGCIAVDPTADVVGSGSRGSTRATVKFDRAAVIAVLGEGRMPVQVTGTLAGKRFVGTDTVHVASRGVRASGAPEHESAIDRPAYRLAVHGTSPGPFRSGSLRLAISLVDASPARMQVLDVAGRSLASRQVQNSGGGRHEVAIPESASWPPGIYLVRLSQGRHSITGRVCLVR